MSAFPDEHHYIFETGINETRERFVTDRLIEFNIAHSQKTVSDGDTRYLAAPLHLYVLAPEGAVVGGLIGRTHQIPEWLEISILWVDEAARGQGPGRQLVERAEQQARERGCRYARLATSDFQAPGFYERLGYCRYGTLEDCPPGETVFYSRKDL